MKTETSLRCRALVVGCLVCIARFPEPAAQPVHSGELPGMPLRRAASQLRAVRPKQRPLLLGVRARGLGAASATLPGPWTGASGVLYEATPRYIKALKRERTTAAGKRGSASMSRVASSQLSFADWELMQQGLELESALQAISDFLDDNEGLIAKINSDLRRGLKNPDAGRSGLAPAEFGGADAGQELGLSRAARADRRRLHPAPVHRGSQPTGAQAPMPSIVPSCG